MHSFTAAESALMASALSLARRGQFTAYPNPMVGCVLTRDGEVVGEGWHERPGGPHAEVHALGNAGSRARGATAYVTLEPCAHHGKTPPCAVALIGAGVARVVIAVEDPNPRVAGKGIAQLREAGIVVDVGLMANSATELNRGFFSRVLRDRPFVRLKLACSLDGAIAMQSGESQWITSPSARSDVQNLRAQSDAILTGIGTVLADDPALTVRSDKFADRERQPLRVVVDSAGRLPAKARMLLLPGTTWACSCEPLRTAVAGDNLENRVYSSGDGRVPLPDVLRDLAEAEVNNLLVEAGPTLAGALLGKQCVDEIVVYQSPDLLGSETKCMLQTPHWTSLADRRQFEFVDVRRVGRDLRVTARPEVQQ